MNHSSLFLFFLILLFFSCGKNTRNSAYEAVLAEARPVDRSTNPYFAQDSFSWSLITPDRVPIYVLEAGRGETVVVLHGGFGMEHSYMRSFLRPFEQDYHMVYYDQRGSLRSPVPDNDYDQYITMDNMVNDLELLRTEIGVEKITLLAHSMGAVLAYEYLKKYPEQVGNVIIISGFCPKFPDSKAAFHDMFQSQQEREAFKTRTAVIEELNKLKSTMDTTSRAYQYLKWKVNYASCQIYNMDNWSELGTGMGFFNPAINEIIGPESNISWNYMWKFYRYNSQFEQGKLEKDEQKFSSTPPVDYLPVIRNHSHKIHYLLGRFEVGDFNLRLYERYLSNVENAELHIFEKACHNIWMDQPEAFASTLAECLAKTTEASLVSGMQ